MFPISLAMEIYYYCFLHHFAFSIHEMSSNLYGIQTIRFFFSYRATCKGCALGITFPVSK